MPFLTSKTKIENCDFCEQYRIDPEEHSLLLNRCLVSEIYWLYVGFLIFYLLFNLYILGVQVFIFVHYLTQRNAYITLLHKTLLPDVFEYTVFATISCIFSFFATAAVLVNLVMKCALCGKFAVIRENYRCFIDTEINLREEQRFQGDSMAEEIKHLKTLQHM